MSEIDNTRLAALRRVQELNDRIDRLMRLHESPRLFIKPSPWPYVDIEHHERVLWSAFCLQWVAIAWCMLIGMESS